MGSLLLGIVLLQSSLFAGDLMQDVQAKLSSKNPVRGTFKQTKFVKKMNVTIESSGDFILEKTTGLHWSQKIPFAFSFKADKEKMEIRSAGGESETMTAKEQPLMFTFSRTFLSLFSGSLSDIKEKFEVTPEGDIKKWKFHLVPKEYVAKKAIHSIWVSGGGAVEQIRVEDKQGNTMNIQLKESQ